MHIKYIQLIFNKGAKAIQWSKYTLFNKWCWNNRTSTGQNIYIYINLDINLIPFTKLKCIRLKCKIQNYKTSRLEDVIRSMHRGPREPREDVLKCCLWKNRLGRAF